MLSVLPAKQEELLTMIDSNNNVLGSVARSRMRKENLFHRATYIFIHNGRGELLVQKRTLFKDYCPGMWDPAAGGCVQANESYEQNAYREVEEEMGIANSGLNHCFTFRFDGLCRVWGDVWSCIWNGPLKLQAEEVADVAAMTLPDILKREAAGEPFTPDGRHALGLYTSFLLDRQPNIAEEQRLFLQSAHRSK